MTTSTTVPSAVERDEESGAFIVSGFDEISEVVRSTSWSSDPRRNALAPAEMQQLPSTIVLFMDPPDHTRLRRLVSPAFTPRAIERLRPRIRAVVDAALSGLGDDIELMTDYAYVVPLAVIAELLDVGAEGAELFQDLTPDLVRMLEFDATAADLELSIDASMDIMMWLTPIIADRKQHPGDDFISSMLQTGLTVDEVISMCILLLAAGHETTANLIGNGTLAVLENPDQLVHLHNDPARAVEELLRVEGPIKVAGRTAIEDVELGGVHVPAGSFALLALDRANVDPRRFDDPLRLDLAREPQGHLAFGGGPHFCLGAALARLEAIEALSGLFTRFPGLRLADEDVQWRNSTTFHALDELHLHSH
jgi:cytochrome P450